MILKNEFLLHCAGSETVLVPTGAAEFSGIVRGNDTLGVMLEQLRDGATEEELIACFKARYDAPEEVISADIRSALDKLREIGALEEQDVR